MTKDEALQVISLSARERDMQSTIELHKRDDLTITIKREDLTITISNGYFDPMLDQIVAAVAERKAKFEMAVKTLAEASDG